MGQYFKPILLDPEDSSKGMWFYTHDYDEGLKIKEHAYVGTDMMKDIISVLEKQPMRVIWAGDYGPEDENGDTMYHKAAGNFEKRFGTCDNDHRGESFIFMNMDNGEWFDLNIVGCSAWGGYDDQYHPLPFLCVDNGDFFSPAKDESMDGRWCGCVIRALSSREGLDLEKEIFPVYTEMD